MRNSAGNGLPLRALTELQLRAAPMLAQLPQHMQRPDLHPQALECSEEQEDEQASTADCTGPHAVKVAPLYVQLSSGGGTAIAD